MLLVNNTNLRGLLIRAASLVLGLFALISCREDIDIDDKIHPATGIENKFEKLFVERFGSVSDDITWMTAESFSASVDLSGLPSVSYELLFSTADPRYGRNYCYLLAAFRNVQGGSTSTFDIDVPSGLKYVYVSAVATSGESYTKRIVTGVGNAVKLPSESNGQFKEPAPMQYRICFDGYSTATPDFDYNDVVIDVVRVRGRGETTVILRAVGNSKHTKVSYRRNAESKNPTEIVLFEEAHEILGYPGTYNFNTDDVEYYILNSGINNSGRTAETTLLLDEEENASITDIIQNFYACYDQEPDNLARVPSKKGSNYPMAFMIADASYRWPVEGRNIGVEYDTFEGWIANPIQNPMWYGAQWKRANILEPENEEDTTPYGRELTIVDGFISASQIHDFLYMSTTITIVVDELIEPGDVWLCKHPNQYSTVSKHILIDKPGVYNIELSVVDTNTILIENTDGSETGIGISYPSDCFDIKGIYIK